MICTDSIKIQKCGQTINTVLQLKSGCFDFWSQHSDYSSGIEKYLWLAHVGSSQCLTVCILFGVLSFELLKKVCCQLTCEAYLHNSLLRAVLILESPIQFHSTEDELFLEINFPVLCCIMPPATLLNPECRVRHAALHVGYRQQNCN